MILGRLSSILGSMRTFPIPAAPVPLPGLAGQTDDVVAALRAAERRDVTAILVPGALGLVSLVLFALRRTTAGYVVAGTGALLGSWFSYQRLRDDYAARIAAAQAQQGSQP